MKIAVLKERAEGEKRIAVSPDSIKKFTVQGAEVHVEAGAGKGASITDQALKDAGAKLHRTAEETLKGAAIVLAVQGPEIALLPKGAVLVAMLNPLVDADYLKALAKAKITAFAMELMPRISRAQAMDVLSSQSNLAGYRAVIDAVAGFGKAVPMMMTAAGTVAPAKVLVLGAGVAGLQAIATARRLGAVVSAFDVRPAVKEQVESLGAKFVEVAAEETADAETKGGYAKEMSADYQRQQAELIHETLKKTDIAISTALIPGKPAPVLITEAMVKDMKEGSIIVDLAVSAGGNCPLSVADKVVTKHGVTILSYSNLPSRVAVDAAPLYARNLYNFLAPFISKEGGLALNWEDELVAGTLVTKDGAVVHPLLKGEKA